ncbi:MAG: TraB/GumN family protein [Sphingomonas sp.]|nr:TraB/GumN family protein [Sphingomonas sp.]
MLVLFVALAATIPSPPNPDIRADEDIVVIARRSGIPAWRARRGGSTLILVGTIGDIAKGTTWDAKALAMTVSRSDRVMYPQSMGLTASPFQLIGWRAKWKKQSKLPKGQSLSPMLAARDRDRLARLSAQGLAPTDWDRMHPLHLAFKMREIVRKRTGIAPRAAATVDQAVRKYKIARVPIARGRGSPLARELFDSSPRDHLTCLSVTLAMSEAGPDELRRRSHAWTNRQVASALRSPMEAVDAQCWPATSGIRLSGYLATTAKSVLAGNGTTLAVLDLRSLAERGGLLDRLQAAGVQIDGPTWR